MAARLILAAVMAALIFTGGYQVAARNYRLQIAERELALAEQYKDQVQEARDETAKLQAAKDKAEAAATTRQNALVAGARRVRAERDGLRDELAAARATLPNASCASVREHAATLNTIFGLCADRLEGLAGQAAGHASDSLKLQQAWPVP